MKRKLVAILFLSIIVSSSTELHQLLKIPILVEHFIEHRQEDYKISFIDFLKIHYHSNPVKDKDYDRDMQLPFKADNCNFPAITFFTHKTSIEIVNKEELISTTHLLHSDEFNSTQVLNNIWQPPRLA